jgi:hypothetical protein
MPREPVPAVSTGLSGVPRAAVLRTGTLSPSDAARPVVFTPVPPGYEMLSEVLGDLY